MGADGAGAKVAPGGGAARAVGETSAHAAASVIAAPAIGLKRARRPLVEKLHEKNKVASPKA
jgi:hypothetical protein